MSLNCLSGLFFILNHLIIKGCKLPNLLLIVVCPEEGIVQQLGSLNSFQKEKTKRYWPKQVNIFTRFVCFVLFFTATVLLYRGIYQTESRLVLFLFLQTSQKTWKRKENWRETCIKPQMLLGFGHRSKEKTLRNQNSTSETCISFFS